MEASGRQWAVAGLGLVAVAAGVGCWSASWWMAALLFKPTTPPAPSPNGADFGLGLLEWAGRVQGLQVGGLLLVVFGLVAWLLTLNHWLWEGGRPGGEKSLDDDRRPRFVDKS